MRNLWILFFFYSLILFADEIPFDQAKTIIIYQSWENYDTGNLVSDVVHLRGG